MKMKYVLVGISALILFFCSLDGAQAKGSGNRRFEVVEELPDIGYREIRDKTTGVHYYEYQTSHQYGLSPVYEADGRVRVTN